MTPLLEGQVRSDDNGEDKGLRVVDDSKSKGRQKEELHYDKAKKSIESSPTNGALMEMSLPASAAADEPEDAPDLVKKEKNKKRRKDKVLEKKEKLSLLKKGPRLKRGTIVEVPRDYSLGITPRFDAAVPVQLTDLLAANTWAAFVASINRHFELADQSEPGESLLAFISCFLSLLCRPTQFDRRMAVLNQFIEQQNADVFAELGLECLPPSRNGFLTIDIRILNDID